MKKFVFCLMLLLPVALFADVFTYTYDFEADDGGFVPYTFHTGCVAAPFEWGEWTQDCAPTGGKVWGANLTAYYQNSAAEILVMPVLTNIDDPSLTYITLEFDHGGKVFTSFDGVSLMYSYTGNIDEDLTDWATVPGALFTQGGYTAACGSACSGVLGGSAEDNVFGEGSSCIGTSEPTHMIVDLTSLAVGSGESTLYIGWLMDTSSVVNYEGYWLDNVVVTADASVPVELLDFSAE